MCRINSLAPVHQFTWEALDVLHAELHFDVGPGRKRRRGVNGAPQVGQVSLEGGSVEPTDWAGICDLEDRGGQEEFLILPGIMPTVRVVLRLCKASKQFVKWDCVANVYLCGGPVTVILNPLFVEVNAGFALVDGKEAFVRVLMDPVHAWLCVQFRREAIQFGRRVDCIKLCKEGSDLSLADLVPLSPRQGYLGMKGRVSRGV